MKKNTENTLFITSGCLTQEAIRLYNDKKLTGKDLGKVEEHLQKCTLCRDAVEGYKLVPAQPEQTESTENIKRGLSGLMNLSSELSEDVIKMKRVYRYVAAAASVIVLAGLFSVYQFLLKPDNEMIAENIKTEKTIPGEMDEKLLQPGDEKEVAELSQKGKSGETAGEVAAERSAGKDNVESDEIALNEMIGAETTAEKGMEKNAITGVAAQPEPSVRQKKGLLVSSNGREDVESIPEFKVSGYKDFNDYIRNNIKYPDTIPDKKFSDTVRLEFIIDQLGKVVEVEVVEGVSEVLDSEAVRVVSSSPRWIPAKKNGEKISFKMKTEVVFDF